MPIALAQVKAGNTSENLLIDIDRLYIFCIEKKKLPKKSIQQYNEFNKVITE